MSCLSPELCPVAAVTRAGSWRSWYHVTRGFSHRMTSFNAFTLCSWRMWYLTWIKIGQRIWYQLKKVETLSTGTRLWHSKAIDFFGGVGGNSTRFWCLLTIKGGGRQLPFQCTMELRIGVGRKATTPSYPPPPTHTDMLLGFLTVLGYIPQPTFFAYK